MKYIKIVNPGPNNRLEVAECDTPSINDNQLLISVKAAGVNRADLLQRQGKYPPPSGETDILGLEVAGDVIAVGKDVTDFKIGDRVYALTGSGAYSQCCPVMASLAHHIPKDWSYTTAAALPEALTTVYATLFELGQLKAGQTLLIHGAGSGIASFAVQLAHLIKANVITTVGNDIKKAKAYMLSADLVINYNERDFEEQLSSNSIDLIVDFVGGDYFNKHLKLLKPRGKLIQIACMKGAHVDCNLGLILSKRLEIHGFVLRPQSIEEKTDLWNKAHQLFSRYHFKPIIDSEYSFEYIEDAHQRMHSSDHFGKIVIRV